MATAPLATCGGVEPHPRHYFSGGAGPTLCPGLVKGETPPPARLCADAYAGRPHAEHEWGSRGGHTYPSTLSWCEGVKTPPPAPAGEAGTSVSGVPVVDLTLMVRQLYVRAEQAREGAVAAASLAAGLRAEADYLETLAGTLDGLPLPPQPSEG